jgi:hypothetical protein
MAPRDRLDRGAAIIGIDHSARYRRRVSNHRRQIKIGEWFPADDPIAVFATTVAMMSNDLLRLVDWLLRSDWTDEKSAADRLFSFRVQAAAFCEASKYLRETPPRWPKIEAFVSDFGPEAAAELARVQAAGDRRAEAYLGKWLTDHATSHSTTPRCTQSGSVAAFTP